MDSALTRGEVIDDLIERLSMEREMELLTGYVAYQRDGRCGSGRRQGVRVAVGIRRGIGGSRLG